MQKGKGIIFFSIFLLAGYVMVASTPLRTLIGRHSPASASIFSPPLLNFSHRYTDGVVMDFRLGMRRDEIFRRLNENYGGVADLSRNCRVTTADSVIRISKELDIASAYGGGRVLCVRLDSRMLALDFEFEGDRVEAIDVLFLRNEST